MEKLQVAFLLNHFTILEIALQTLSILYKTIILALNTRNVFVSILSKYLVSVANQAKL